MFREICNGLSRSTKLLSEKRIEKERFCFEGGIRNEEEKNSIENEEVKEGTNEKGKVTIVKREN
tara:strand:- start:1628 stop:1819 length:192 start_codon:yes stop_codon:yes gene_type:complete